MDKSTKHWVAWIVGSAIIASAAVFALTPRAHAADLGGNCCSDLEERVAELEATTARKGNRKLSLTVDGQINGGYSLLSIGDYREGKITSSNGNDRSYVGFTGEAQFAPTWKAGYRVEIDLEQLGVLGEKELGNDSRTGVRQSYWYIDNKELGRVSVGKQGVSTNDLDEWSVSKAWLAGKPLSVGPLSDTYLTGIDVPFDGSYRNAVKYESPTLAGFKLAATWGDSFDAKDSDGNGNTYDIALRYFTEYRDFKVAGAAGFRHDTDLPINVLGITTITLPTGDVDTFLANGSVMHIPSGLFIGASYANQKWDDFGFRLEGLDVTGGIEARLIPLGKTTFSGSWGRFTVSPDGSGDTDIDYYGLGIVQSIDAAAMELYAGYRHYDTSDVLGDNVESFNIGARIKF